MSPDLRLLIDLLGLAMVGVAFLALVGAWLWVTVMAFQTHPAWGAACYFLPWYTVQYAVDHWRDVRSPALLALAACLCVGCVFLTDELIERKYGPRPHLTSASHGTRPGRH